jgi:hypothetical protein
LLHIFTLIDHDLLYWALMHTELKPPARARRQPMLGMSNALRSDVHRVSALCRIER